MIGYIACPNRCNCGGIYRWDHRNALFCEKCGAECPGPFTVRFGRKINHHFKYDYHAAENYLSHLRHKKSQGTFDVRDYMSSQPLGFVQQATKWLEIKSEKLIPKVLQNMELTMTRAAAFWGNRNVKDIREGDIEDFLRSLKVGQKTRHNYNTYLIEFWKWLNRREKIPMLEFPNTKDFVLGFRKVISIKMQQEIIDEAKNIIYKRNPKVWLGIRMLSRYIQIRPGELMRIIEGNIDLDIPAMLLPPEDAKIRQPLMVFLWPDDVEEIKAMPRGLPDLLFFRHPANKRAEAGQPFGQRFLYKIWVQACKNLGYMRTETRPITDLYAGTRHSTITALGELYDRNKVKEMTGHRTNKALDRYLQVEARYAQKNADLIFEMQQKARSEKKGQIINFNKKR